MADSWRSFAIGSASFGVHLSLVSLSPATHAPLVSSPKATLKLLASNLKGCFP